MDKKINYLKVENHRTSIDSGGEIRTVQIYGTVGAIFSLTIKDSTDCSILDEEIENVEIPKGGKYILRQEFPSIVTSGAGGLIEEYYEVTITPSADVELPEEINNGIPTFTLYQYPDPTVTITTTTSQTAPTISVAGGNITKTSNANSVSGNRGSTTWTLTLTEGSGTNGNFYVKDPIFNKHLIPDTIIKKIVNTDGVEGHTRTLQLKPLTTRTKNDIISGDLSKGMRVHSKITETKIITNSLDVPSCRRKTNRFEVNNTTGIFPGMLIYPLNKAPVSVVSVDCNTEITVSEKIIIRKNTNADFKYTIGATIDSIEQQVNSKGETCVMLDRPIYILDGTELSFDDRNSFVSGTLTSTGSGSDTVVLTISLEVVASGTSDITYSLDLDSMITRKPNARNYEIEVSKNSVASSNIIRFHIGDFDSNALTKVLSITKNPSNGTVTSYTRSTEGYTGPTITYAPFNGFTGDDEIRYKLRDDDSSTDFSDEKVISITVK